MRYETVAEAYSDLERAGGRLALIDRLAVLLVPGYELITGGMSGRGVAKPPVDEAMATTSSSAQGASIFSIVPRCPCPARPWLTCPA